MYYVIVPHFNKQTPNTMEPTQDNFTREVNAIHQYLVDTMYLSYKIRRDEKDLIRQRTYALLLKQIPEIKKNPKKIDVTLR